LQEIFGEYGVLADVFVPNEPKTGRSRGFAFVTFADERDATTAMRAMDKARLDGRELRVNIARPKGADMDDRAEDVCRDFQRGVCRRGSKCRFVHARADQSSGEKGRDDRGNGNSFRKPSGRGRGGGYGGRPRDRDAGYARDRDVFRDEPRAPGRDRGFERDERAYEDRSRGGNGYDRAAGYERGRGLERDGYRERVRSSRSRSPVRRMPERGHLERSYARLDDGGFRGRR